MPWFTRKRYWIAAGLVVLIPIVGFAWWLGSPLLFDKTVEEEFPMAHTAVVPANMKRSEVEDVMMIMSKVDAPMAEAMPPKMAEATVVKAGQFMDADRFHKGEGKATIYALPDGAYVLRLESLKVTNGPALVVILTPHSDPGSRDEVRQEGHVELGKLKGNIGNQNYPIPVGVDPATVRAAVIYCKPFNVVFSMAQLR